MYHALLGLFCLLVTLCGYAGEGGNTCTAPSPVPWEWQPEPLRSDQIEVHSRLSTCLINLPTLHCGQPHRQAEKRVLDDLAKQFSAVRIGEQPFGKKLSIRYNHQPLTELMLSHEQLNAMAQHSDNTEALLCWLNETFGEQNDVVYHLLNLLPSPHEYDAPMDEESHGKAIQSNITQAIKQSGSGFVLELGLLPQSHSQTRSANPFNAIVTAHNGKEKTSSSAQSTGSGSSSKGAEGGGSNKESGSGQKQQPAEKKGQKPPKQPERTTRQHSPEMAAQFYRLKVGSSQFRLERVDVIRAVSQPQDISQITVTRESDGIRIKLSEVEFKSALPLTHCLGSDGDVLDYLFLYGTLDTLRETFTQLNPELQIPEDELMAIPKVVFAALNHRTKIVERLINAGESDPLAQVVQCGFLACAEALLKQGTVVDAFLEDDATPLYSAVDNQNEPMVQLLLHYKANPNSPRASDGITPFHLAIKKGLVTIAQHLLNAGADRYLPASDGAMPWQMIPVNIGRVAEEEMIRLTRIIKMNTSEQFELFLKAIEEDNVDGVHNFMREATELLLAGQQSSVFRAERRPLHIAVEKGNPAIVYQLVKVEAAYQGPVEKHSAFYEIVNGTRQSDMCAPLHIAVLKYDQAFQALQQAETAVIQAKEAAKTDSSNKELTQKYSEAEKVKQQRAKVADNYLIIIDQLLEHSANPNVQRQSDGATPLYLASARGLLKVVQKLTFKKSTDRDNPGAQVNQPRRLDKATPLHAAAQNGHLKVVEHLLTTLADTNARTQGAGGQCPLEFALKNGHTHVAQKLASRGDTLFNACREGNIGLIRLALEAGISANTERRCQYALIHLAAENDNNNIVQLLLQHGANIDKTYIHGNTALHYATIHGHLAVVETLLNHGSQAWAAPNSTQYTPLQLALLNHHRDIANLLLEHEHGVSLFMAVDEYDAQYLKRLKLEGITTSVVDPENGNTPLHEAVRKNRYGCVAVLMDKDLLEKPNHTGQTPLEMALTEKNRSVLATLAPFLSPALIKAVELNQPNKVAAILDAGLSPNQQDEASGEYPLHLAARKGNNDMVTLLLAKAAYPDLVSDNKKLTPVEEALNHHQHSTVMLLLNKGGSDVWFSAARNKKEGLIDRLISAGVSVNRVDSQGETALHKAAKYGSLNVVRVLLCGGADKSLKNRDGKKAYQLARSKGFSGEIIELLDDPICRIL